jgi:hypothetical protein
MAESGLIIIISNTFRSINTSGKNSPKNSIFYQVLRLGKSRFADSEKVAILLLFSV